MDKEGERIQLSNGYHVWVKRIGTGATKILLLHGGPGGNYLYMTSFDQYMPKDEYQFIYYDQLGSYMADHPDDVSLWNVERFREEVEEVRQALQLTDFYLLGHSWGGMLAIEYALKYQNHLKGVIISNMTASIPSYVKHMNILRDDLPADEVAFMQDIESKGEYSNEKYQQIMMKLYHRHVCRLDPWPEAVMESFGHLNQVVYNTMQGPNEFLVTGNFKDWDRWNDLHRITIPSLTIVGRHDTMSVEDITEMHNRLSQGSGEKSGIAICEEGSHMSHWDDASSYFSQLLAWLGRQ